MEIPATDRGKRQTSHDFSKKLIKLTLVGGVAFWIVDFAISLSPISAEYVAAFSISYFPLALVTAFIGGLVIAFCVSYFLLHFFKKIPAKNPVLKSVILGFAAIIIIEVLSTFGNPSNAYVYLLVDTVMNIPRILALGIVIGYLYQRLNGSEFTPIDKHN
jgi:hypothetical protein